MLLLTKALWPGLPGLKAAAASLAACRAPVTVLIATLHVCGNCVVKRKENGENWKQGGKEIISDIHKEIWNEKQKGTKQENGKNWKQGGKEIISDIHKGKRGEKQKGMKQKNACCVLIEWQIELVTGDWWGHLQHLHNIETPFYRPQTFLSLDFQCRMFLNDVSELK